jgi:hypothetical protein
MYILLAGAFVLGALLGVVIISLLIIAQESDEPMELLGMDRKSPLDSHRYPDSFPDTLPRKSERILWGPHEYYPGP